MPLNIKLTNAITIITWPDNIFPKIGYICIKITAIKINKTALIQSHKILVSTNLIIVIPNRS
jgi:hypothetical protein